MAKQNGKTPKKAVKKALKKGIELPKAVTPLGKYLLKARAKYIASGGKLLSIREIQREVAELRGGR
ncbi:MAG: hypothetical protein HY820_37325 [Acidobacteria bacterium]|nr:hypothetical protein [Acidobacteriota bacterium]